MNETAGTTPEERAHQRVKSFTDLMWHVATYVIVNAFLWIIVPGAAFWVTLFWGIGLAFHVVAYFLDKRGGQSRRYRRFLAEEQERETGDPA